MGRQVTGQVAHGTGGGDDGLRTFLPNRRMTPRNRTRSGCPSAVVCSVAVTVLSTASRLGDKCLEQRKIR